MRIKLSKLFEQLQGYTIRGSSEIEIAGITTHSKQVGLNFLFIAKKGATHDGSSFISEAVANGAIAILTDLYNPFFSHITQILHPDPSLIEAKLAQEYWGYPSDKLFLVGITGTNGKTTTAYLIEHLFNALKEPSGLIGTIEWRVGDGHIFPAQHTTPDVLTNCKLMHEMLERGCTSCVSEVSSHALSLGRVSGMVFDVAVFTNLTQDHLDFHGSMEHYAATKARLFSSLYLSQKAVINIDSPYAEAMIAACEVPILTYGIEREAMLRAENIRLHCGGIDFDVCVEEKSHRFSSSLVGRYNVYNFLAAIGVGLCRGFPLERILKALHSFSAVPGRLERVKNERGLNIFVDYAHTEDALLNVLKAVRELTEGKVITVFGCGGGRDPGKRPKMGKVATSLSDLAIVTTDNPRHEDPEEIIRQILGGIEKDKAVRVIQDRSRAIAEAIASASEKDIVLIAGKGHETYQIFAHQTVAFDDRLVAAKAAALKI